MVHEVGLAKTSLWEPLVDLVTSRSRRMSARKCITNEVLVNLTHEQYYLVSSIIRGGSVGVTRV